MAFWVLKMADSANLTVATRSKVMENVPVNSGYICVKCIELENQLKEAVEELKSARLIIELLQQESVPKITSKQDIRRSNASHVATNQGTNTDWVEESSRCSGPINKDKGNFLKKISTRANMYLTVSNPFPVFGENEAEKGRAVHPAGTHNVVVNNRCDKIEIINRERLNEQKKVIKGIEQKPSAQLETRCVHEQSSVEPHRSQDTEGKMTRFHGVIEISST
jgi:hypothetical protein